MKIRKKVLIVALAALLLGCLGLGVLFLQTDKFQEMACATLISRLEKATGLDCRIGRFQLDVLRGRFKIAGLELISRPEDHRPVTVRIGEIKGTLSISSFWHFRLRLAELDVVRPELQLISGSGNSSWNPDELVKTLKIALRLEAARVSIRNGWIQINGRGGPFDLSLKDLDCEIRYVQAFPGYRISLEYKQSRLFYEGRDITHDLEARMNLSLQGIEIEFFKFLHGPSLLTGAGHLGPWEAPSLLLHATGILGLRDLILAHPSLSEGRGSIYVVADVRHDSGGIYSKGKFSARSGWYRKMAFDNLMGAYEIEHDVLHLRDVSGRIAKGSFLANGDIQLREANKAPNIVKISAKNVPLIEGGRLLNLPLVNFENTADSTITLMWGHDLDLKADCDADLHSLEQPAAPSGKSTLLHGNVRFSYYETGAVDIASANLSSPYTAVQATGGKDSWFHVRIATSRLAEPLGLIAGFSPPITGLIKERPDLLEMPGSYEIDGDVRVKSSSDVDYRGGVLINGGSWRSFKADALSAQANWSAPHLTLRSLMIQSGPQFVKGKLDLELSESEQVSSLRFEGDVGRISLDFLKDLGTETKITGTLSGSGAVSYEQGRWEGDGQFSVENGSINGEPFDDLRAQVRLKNQLLRLLRGEATRGATRISADGQVDLGTRQLNLATRLHGLSLDDIPAVRKKNLPVQGRASASGVLKGTAEHPSFKGDFELDGLRYDSWDLGRGKGNLELQDGTVLASARIQSEFGNLSIQANVSTGHGYPGKATLEFENLNVQKIIPGKVPPYLRELSTDLRGRIQVDGKLEDWAALTMHGEMDGVHFKIHDYELHNAGQIRFTIVNNDFRAENVRIEGEETGLILSGTIPLDGSPRLDLNLSGSMSLRLLEGIEKKLRPSGAVSLNIRTSGTMQDPQIIGRASFKDARLDYAELPLRISAVNGDIVFSRNLVRFENVRGAAASGTFQVSGLVEHQNAMLRSINIGVSAQNVRLLYPKDFRSIVNAELLLSGNSDFQVLTGEVDVIRAEYIRSFNLLEQLAGRSAIQSGPLTVEPYLLGLRLNVDIHSNGGLLIDNELARLRGSLRLTLRGTPAYPSLTGHVEAGEGTIFFRGSRFQISHAVADFTDRNRINPFLEVRAEADVKTYRLILDANGHLDHLNISVTSDPPMSTVDILSLLTTGKTETGTETSRRESEMASVSAASVLSENLTGVLGKRVQRIFGLESFRVDPFLAGAENDPTARVTISERLSKDLVVTFSRNITTNQEQIVIIEYDIGKSLSVVATRDEDGKYGLDFRFRKRLR